MRRALAIVFACVAVALSPHAQAQKGLARPTRLIVTTGMGAASDIMARLLANGIGSASSPW
jgi:tripartite-type tricarboxylate transporter receptor subunit TctC